MRLRYAAFASVGCMELERARRPASVTEIIGTVRAQKRRSKQRGTSTVALGAEVLRKAWCRSAPTGCLVNGRFGAHNGLKSDIAALPKSAKLGSHWSHSITSSAKADNDGGIVSCNTLAVRMLIRKDR